MERDALDHLADALLEDITGASGDDLMAEVEEDFGDTGVLAVAFDEVLSGAEALALRQSQDKAIGRLADALSDDIAATPPEELLREAAEDYGSDRALAVAFDHAVFGDDASSGPTEMASAGAFAPMRSRTSLKTARAPLLDWLTAPLRARTAMAAFAALLLFVILAPGLVERYADLAPELVERHADRIVATENGPVSRPSARPATLPAPQPPDQVPAGSDVPVPSLTGVQQETVIPPLGSTAGGQPAAPPTPKAAPRRTAPPRMEAEDKRPEAPGPQLAEQRRQDALREQAAPQQQKQLRQEAEHAANAADHRQQPPSDTASAAAEPQSAADRNRLELTERFARAREETRIREGELRKPEAGAEANRKATEAEVQRRLAGAGAQRETKRNEADRRPAALPLQQHAPQLPDDPERKRIAETCQREEAALDDLKTAGAAAREQLAKFETEAECKVLRPFITAALAALPPGVPDMRAPVPEAQPTKANQPEQIRQAQAELSRLGCFKGKPDGLLNDDTQKAIQAFRARTGGPFIETGITDELIADLRQQPNGVCNTTRPPTVAARPALPPSAAPSARSAAPARAKPAVGAGF